MTPPPNLRELIATVEGDAPSVAPLDLLATASTTASELRDTGDALLDHYVARCRASGLSWAEISGALGVSKQAVHKRFSMSTVGLSRMTDRARRTLDVATDLARDRGHEAVGSEHILLAQFAEPQALAARALVQLGTDEARVTAAIRRRVPDGTAAVEGAIGYSPQAAAIVAGSVHEALELGHNYVGTEHLLLALVHDPDCVAAQVLDDLGVDRAGIRPTLLALLDELLGGSA